MTYITWEKQLLGYLKNQTDEDKIQIVDYYREMYYDKVEQGISHEQILAEFGDPMNCANKILAEHASNNKKEEKVISKENIASKNASASASRAPRKKTVPIGAAVGWFFITILLLIPLGAAAISVVVSFAAVAISGYAVILAGAIFAIVSPIGLFLGWSGAQTIVSIGTGIAATGVGAILAVVFTLLTKYSALCLYKAVRTLIKGGGKK